MLHDVEVVDSFRGLSPTGKGILQNRCVSYLLHRKLGVLEEEYTYPAGYHKADNTVLRKSHIIPMKSIVDFRWDRKGQRTKPRAIYYRNGLMACMRSLGHAEIGGQLEIANKVEPVIAKIDRVFMTMRLGIPSYLYQPIGIEIARLLDDIGPRVREINLLNAQERLLTCIYWPLGPTKPAVLKVKDRTGRTNLGMFYLKMPAVLHHLGKRRKKIQKIRPFLDSRSRAALFRTKELNKLAADLYRLTENFAATKKVSYKILRRQLIEVKEGYEQKMVRPYVDNAMSSIEDIDKALGIIAILDKWSNSADENIERYKNELAAYLRKLKAAAQSFMMISDCSALVWTISSWRQLAYHPTEQQIEWFYSCCQNLKDRLKSEDDSDFEEPVIYPVTFGLNMLLEQSQAPTRTLEEAEKNFLVPAYNYLEAIVDSLSFREEVVYLDGSKEVPY